MAIGNASSLFGSEKLSPNATDMTLKRPLSRTLVACNLVVCPHRVSVVAFTQSDIFTAEPPATKLAEGAPAHVELEEKNALIFAFASGAVPSVHTATMAAAKTTTLLSRAPDAFDGPIFTSTNLVICAKRRQVSR